MKRIESPTRRLLIALAAAWLVPFDGAGAGDLSSDDSVAVEPTSVELYSQHRQQLIVTRRAHWSVDLTSHVEYATSDPAVAEVSSAGLIRARKPGNAVIRVRWSNREMSVPVRVRAGGEAPAVSFSNDVVPLLTKLGCNSGGCHGKATGQNGFKLSLLGFDTAHDHQALVKQARGRRLFMAAPARSLLLLKAVARVPHGGGQRLDEGSDDYRLLKRWISQGAKPAIAGEPALTRIEVTPQHRVMRADGKKEIGSSQQLLVTAHLSDGSIRDVTRRAVYHSNESAIGDVSKSGMVTTHERPGLFAVMVRFGGKIDTFHASVPFQVSPQVQEQLNALEARYAKTKIDRLLFRQWRELGLIPSPPAEDGIFIRRVTVDICGTLPTEKEVTDFVNDQRPDKHEKLVDRLLRRPEYAAYFALKWADILQNRGRGYSTRKQRAGTALFSGWIRDSIATNKPYDQFVAEIVTATGSQLTNPPAVWHRSVRTLPNYVESVAQAFLGVRIQCAQCHHHPFDRWSQSDYYGLAAVFARVGRKNGFADAEVPTNETIYLKTGGEVRHPRTGKLIRPGPLGGAAFDLDRGDDPRLRLARWMTADDNPFFARTMANRMWAHFMGRGIVHPIDDSRSTNPPTNPALMNALATDFKSSGYDVRQLIRMICTSHAYRLRAAPNQVNLKDTQNFARFYPRRMIAEVLLDGISQVLEVPTDFSGAPGKFPLGTRAIDLPDENVPAHFLDVFGRPARTSACECERGDAPSLAQALELVNSSEIQRKLTAKTGWAARLAANQKSHSANTRDIFLRLFSRLPSQDESRTAKDFLDATEDRAEGYRSLLWALLATNEFLFNH